MMSIVIKTLSDADVADLAAYYASIEITAKPPAMRRTQPRQDQ